MIGATVLTTVVVACAAIVPACQPQPTGTEIIVNAGDPVPNITPPDTLTIAYPGADGYDDGYYRADCAAMGGTFVVRWSNDSGTAVCQAVDF